MEYPDPRLEFMAEIGHMGYWRLDLKTGRVTWSAHVYRLHGFDPGDAAAAADGRIARCPAADQARLADAMARAIRERGEFRLTLTIARADGSLVDVECAGRCECDQASTIVALFGVLRDLGERIAAAEEVERTRSLLDALESIGDAVVLHDEADRLILFNSAASGFYPGRPDLLRHGRSYVEIMREAIDAGFIPDAVGREEAFLQERLAGRRRLDAEPAIRRLADGRYIEISDRRSRSGGIISIARDVSRLMAQQEALRQSEAKVRLIADNLPALVGYIDRDERYQFVNRRYEEWWCRPAADIVGCSVWDLVTPGIADAAAMELIRSNLRRAFTGETLRFQASLNFPDGNHRICELTYAPLRTDGGLEGLVVIGQDVTARIATEAQLQRAQRMEAIGHLTGGVAHDFNNLLAVIAGNLELLQEDLGERPEYAAFLAPAIEAAERGAGLTQRLLAFARRQPLQPSVIEANQQILEMARLLQRALGEAVTVRLELAPDLWPCIVDPGQLESALLNLSINARDAMPSGGLLTIRTTNEALDAREAMGQAEITAGGYVCITVSDNGMGIAPERLERVFEPFFTTKDVGKGSGLGLSMVYGFAKQSGGHVCLNSALGRGTDVHLYLPRSPTPAAASTPAPARPPLRGGTETVLVVEDNAPMRELSMTALRALGYRVFAAGDARAALDILEAGLEVDVLFSDIVLPGGVNGFELARSAQQRRPGLKLVFASGFADPSSIDSFGADRNIVMLKKPFRTAELAQKIRQVIEE